MARSAHTKASIRGIGSHMVSSYADGEYRVTMKVEAIMMVNDCPRSVAKERAEAIAYYTNDGDDAVNAAKAMHDQFVHSGRI